MVGVFVAREFLAKLKQLDLITFDERSIIHWRLNNLLAHPQELPPDAIIEAVFSGLSPELSALAKEFAHTHRPPRPPTYPRHH